MHMLKYSQDDSSKRLYDYMRERERDKPPLNGLGIPIKPRVWKPTNAVEDAEHNFYLDSIAVGQQCNVRVNKSSVKMDRNNTLKRINRDDEEVRLICCYGYAIQGDWLSLDAVLEADLSRSSLIYSIPQELLKFLMILLPMSCLHLIILNGGGRLLWIWNATCMGFFLSHT